MNITSETINEIRNKLDIVEVISNYVPLTQHGKNYFGVCPFHDDHSPSMSVSREKQIFTCFSCGATGNVFTFVADYLHIGFYDAVRLLGNKVGYNFKTYTTKNDRYDEFYQIYDLACKFYQNNLNTSLGKNALSYLEKRQIDKETIKKFRIGLSIQNMSLTDFLLNKKVTLDKLIKLGISNDNGSDLFVSRIIFPLYDLDGNIVGFSGRIYNTSDTSKYINTKETVIFKKGNILYNYHNARDKLKKNEFVIVMEGFMDVIRSNTVGITNCVATMGTALTKQNASLLKKMAKNIILCFDGDKAGEEATVKAIDVFKEIDVNPKIVRLEEGMDPDEYILKYGVEKFRNKIDNPDSSIDFMMLLHRNNKNFKDIEDISKYVDESINDLVYIDDPVLVELSLNKLEKEFSISYQVLRDKYDKIKGTQENKINTSSEKSIEHKQSMYNQYDSASRSLIFYMLRDEKIINMVEEKVVFFPDELIRKLANKIIYYYKKYNDINIADFISYVANDKDELDLLNQVLNMKNKDRYIDEEIDDYIRVVNSYPVKNRIKELNKKLKEENEPMKQANILSEILSLKGVKQ